jgi:hypothetical protein
MSIYGRLHADGSLTDIRYTREPGNDDVSLVAMPFGFGPFRYDEIGKVAVKVRGKGDVTTFGEIIGPMQWAALVVLASPSNWSRLEETQRRLFQDLIDEAAALIVQTCSPSAKCDRAPRS